MTADLETLIQGVIDHPHDDERRLVLADYLEEHGDGRAELIRIQLQIAKLPKRDSRRQSLRRRVSKIRMEHGGFEVPEAPFKPRGEHGGFLSAIEITIPRFLKHQHAIFNGAPITNVTLTGGAAKLSRVAESPYLDRLLTLKIDANADSQQVVDVITSKGLAHVKEMTIYTPHLWRDGSMVGEMIRDHAPASLESLDCHFHAQTQVLGESKHLKLKSFTARFPIPRDDGQETHRAIASSPVYSDLECLYLVGPTDVVGLGLVATALQKTLRVLHVYGTDCTFDSAPATLPKLEELVVGTPFSVRAETTCIDVARHPERFPRLELLDLDYTQVGDAGALALAESPLLSQLKVIKLRGGGMTPTGVRALAESPYRPQRGQKLHLGGNLIPQQEVRKLQAEYGKSFGDLGDSEDYRWV